jgi:hypothetical protein
MPAPDRISLGRDDCRSDAVCLGWATGRPRPLDAWRSQRSEDSCLGPPIEGYGDDDRFCAPLSQVL